MARQESALTGLARLGFTQLRAAEELLRSWDAAANFLPLLSASANPDQALRMLVELRERAAPGTDAVLADPAAASRLIRVLGASKGLAEFFLRHPAEVAALADALPALPDADSYRADLLAAVAGLRTEVAVNILRKRYRWHLARIAAWDLEQADALGAVDSVGMALADLAGATLDAALSIARGQSRFPKDETAATRLAIIGMGKAGARELNYVSDVDVLFVAEPGDAMSNERAVQIGTALAIATSQAIFGLATEPELWEVDANLRPEGKDGALVRTLESHLAYYARWAKGWEFQALLKARPLAGDLELGGRFVDAVAPAVWSSASGENFVESVQRMRERVTANIPRDEVDVQLKLGPGGLRDVEFTIQLLQLVHGQTDPGVRQRGTLPALHALAERSYIGREESAEFSQDYRFLRLLEHRLQLAQLRRTHLMPREPEDLRLLARASGLPGAEELTARWQRTKTAVRGLHERLFYRPLLAAVAHLPEGGMALSSENAAARLAAIGFTDPQGALRHIAALTAGVSRRAAIQRNLLPVILQWLAEGADPDRGLLAFRRLSDDLGETHWYLRMLRDSSGAAHRLAQLLAGSRFVGDLLEGIPEAVAWLEADDQLQPRDRAQLLQEVHAIVKRHARNQEAGAGAIRAMRRREVLRLAISSILGLITVEQLASGLTDVVDGVLTGMLALAHPQNDGIEFAIIAMGRYGGAELGIGSDADVMYVYRAGSASAELAQSTAEKIVGTLSRLTEDVRLPLDLDINLRPEGKNGAIVRSLDSYRAYYARWSLTWEAQALLRARTAVGDGDLLRDFEALADEVRYPVAISDKDVREIKRIKARVESERLPQGADPSRHLKLGRGSLSDVEWFVQLLQLQHGARIAALRTTSTLEALAVATRENLVSEGDSNRLQEAWLFASRTRSAMTLWTSKTTDVLPGTRAQLEGVARIMGYPPGSANALESDYLRVTRRARHVFEREFYGVLEGSAPEAG
ncbi:bifunctional [glutamine synthetase] adenylyltransferase/[glutamine synthetase]-adenylyl-L-tyrosine phosphorylase [Parafrigoribacterium mesophilum]|uniref:bifunctional [glutamine synthetase] adenylyltransferase/[glutamine synthetase]-adenylyl-L-tyrosine phosphorylase n=1 Tax=Parafrigoribacterium mesophilum TaxID=433646 RepID=UPI0031FD31C2